MSTKKVNLDELRHRAMIALQSARQLPERDEGVLESDGAYRLIEELRVYQTELEIQNQELVKSQDELSRTSAKYQALFTGLPIPALLCDSRGFIIEMNRAASRLLEVQGSLVSQRYSFIQFIDHFNRSWVQSILMVPLEPNKPSLRQVSIVLPGGILVPSEVRIQQVDSQEEGRVVSLVTIIDKSLEVEYAQQSVDLARAKEVAEAASKAKSQFLANMSHELRTPLSGILGLTHILQGMTHDEQSLDKLRKIQASGKHLTQLIEDILDLTKIEAGKLALENVVFSLREVVSATVALIEPKALAKHLKIMTDIHPDVPAKLHGDPLRLRQALLNYLGNAVKFSEKGEIWLHVRLEKRHYNEALLRFEVQDNRPGIPEEVLPHLFNTFVQGDSSFARRHGGSGLGLAITKQLALLMKGDVGVVSTPGHGARFWFSGVFICDTSSDPVAAEPAVEADNALEMLKENFGGRSVLVCEDDPVNAEIIAYLLEDAGLVADKAGDGRAALEQAMAKPYDLILMDLQMPNMTGLEATLAIRELPGHEKVPIIALTANVFTSDRDACLAAGMNDFLAKPIDQFQFYSVLLKQFQHSQNA